VSDLEKFKNIKSHATTGVVKKYKPTDYAVENGNDGSNIKHPNVEKIDFFNGRHGSAVSEATGGVASSVSTTAEPRTAGRHGAVRNADGGREITVHGGPEIIKDLVGTGGHKPEGVKYENNKNKIDDKTNPQ
jgi:hypothetical protein